jgi:selenocysteine lyase/cysteine desulfurase
MATLEQYFEKYRNQIIGNDASFVSPYGLKEIAYCDWIASGRLYAPIENILLKKFAPYVANTHTETSATGVYMTKSYHEAKHIIKHHVNANDDDVLISYGSGMTAVVNKFQRILGLRIPEVFKHQVTIAPQNRPVVFVSHMEHHSNQTSWIETICEVVKIEPNADGNIDINNLYSLLEQYKYRSVKIAAISACSNVTGIITPYHKVASVMHEYGGLCFVDFACSAPYVDINMHPKEATESLDAIYFSPHKFLGGPGTCGVLIFNKNLYKNAIPDNPGGGTVKWTNAWNGREYLDNIEDREDGGTPPFLQTIKTALAIKLKEAIGVANITAREHEIQEKAFKVLRNIHNLKIMGDTADKRIGVVSFYIEQMHYNLTVKLLNDKYGIQVRGGCFCAGTYGHYLFNISQENSDAITQELTLGIMCNKPGWIRLSLHPTISETQLDYVLNAITELAATFKTLEKDYTYDANTNEYYYNEKIVELDIASLFEMPV